MNTDDMSLHWLVLAIAIVSIGLGLLADGVNLGLGWYRLKGMTRASGICAVPWLLYGIGSILLVGSTPLFYMPFAIGVPLHLFCGFLWPGIVSRHLAVQHLNCAQDLDAS